MDQATMKELIADLLEELDPRPEREGLKETPARVAKAWKEWTAGYDESPNEILKVFADGAESYDEMVHVGPIPVYSHCEHHLAPFFGVAHVAYIPNKKIVGLSKLPRLVHCFSRRLQVQERLTTQIAETIESCLHPIGVGVSLRCRHLCMESRGIKLPGSTTTTSKLIGAIKDRAEARAEFYKMIDQAERGGSL